MYILVFPQLLKSRFFPARALQVWLMFSFPLALVIPRRSDLPATSPIPLPCPVTKDSSSIPTFYNTIRIWCKASHQLKPKAVSCTPPSFPFPVHLVVLTIQKHSWWLYRLSLSYAPARRQFSLASIRYFRIHASRLQLFKQDWSIKQHSLLYSVCYISILLSLSTSSTKLLGINTLPFNSSIILNL